jgi:hypothetical protein
MPMIPSLSSQLEEASVSADDFRKRPREISAMTDYDLANI